MWWKRHLQITLHEIFMKAVVKELTIFDPSDATRLIGQHNIKFRTLTKWAPYKYFFRKKDHPLERNGF